MTAPFKHILVPTDGSKLSLKAVKSAMKLASTLGARVTGLYCIAPYVPPMYAEGFYAGYPTVSQQRAAGKKAAGKALAQVEASARAAGVACATATVDAGTPWAGILKAAKSKRADLIVMASHGRRGLSGLLLGSETTKVLTHSKVPVLVVR